MIARALQIRLASPHEVLTAAACSAAAVWALISPKLGNSATLASTFRGWPSLVFNLALLASGLMVLVGAYLAWAAVRHPRRYDLDTALSLERWGLGIAAPLVTAFAAAVLIASGVSGLLSASLSVGVAIADVVRMRRISYDIERWRLAMINPTPADPPPLAEGGGE